MSGEILLDGDQARGAELASDDTLNATVPGMDLRHMHTSCSGSSGRDGKIHQQKLMNSTPLTSIPFRGASCILSEDNWDIIPLRSNVNQSPSSDLRTFPDSDNVDTTV